MYSVKENDGLFILGVITIPDGILFAVDSDLNEASPQFTLTCISTGGPATTVTWTKDSVTVTEGTKTVLDNQDYFTVHPHPDCNWETGRTLHMYCD